MKKKPKRPAHDVAASLTLHHPDRYSESGMREIQKWAARVLRDVARYRKAGKIDGRFTARYYCAKTACPG